jgi:hypothetical protein
MSIFESTRNQTTTQTAMPPSYLMPYITRGLQGAQSLYDQGPAKYYPGQTVVPFSTETETALQGIAQRAQAGSPINSAAQTYATNTLTNPITSQFGAATNPYLDATFNRAADSVQNRLQTGFARSGRNIEAARPIANQELGDLANTIYGGAYENERNRMASDISQQRGLQASVLGMAPQISNLGYADYDRMLGVGGLREDLTGRQYEDAAARYDFEQNAPGVALDQYLNRSRGLPGGSSTTTTPMYRNRATGALGGAVQGYDLGSSIGSGYGGYGALIGGLLGGWG